MFYTVYKITNTVNGKIYIGAHKTSDLDDGYMGSGKVIKRAHKKYGIENFGKEILEIFDTSEEMFEMEAKLVTKEFISEDTNYNLKEGGEGGFDYINNNGINNNNGNNIAAGQATKAMFAENPKKVIEMRKKAMDGYALFLEQRKLDPELDKWYREKCGASFKGKTHSQETKQQMSDSHKGKHDGEKNSQFGSMWIHSLTEKKSKKIKKDELQTYEDLGWIKGRKMKFL